VGQTGRSKVIVVGAGPTGLMLAAELALARADCLVLERRDGLRYPFCGRRPRRPRSTRHALARRGWLPDGPGYVIMRRREEDLWRSARG
jgi:flavin-dependent dehydrogenase